MNYIERMGFNNLQNYQPSDQCFYSNFQESLKRNFEYKKIEEIDKIFEEYQILQNTHQEEFNPYTNILDTFKKYSEITKTPDLTEKIKPIISKIQNERNNKCRNDIAEFIELEKDLSSNYSRFFKIYVYNQIYEFKKFVAAQKESLIMKSYKRITNEMITSYIKQTGKRKLNYTDYQHFYNLRGFYLVLAKEKILSKSKELRLDFEFLDKFILSYSIEDLLSAYHPKQAIDCEFVNKFIENELKQLRGSLNKFCGQPENGIKKIIEDLTTQYNGGMKNSEHVIIKEKYISSKRSILIDIYYKIPEVKNKSFSVEVFDKIMLEYDKFH